MINAILVVVEEEEEEEEHDSKLEMEKVYLMSSTKVSPSQVNS